MSHQSSMPSLLKWSSSINISSIQINNLMTSLNPLTPAFLNMESSPKMRLWGRFFHTVTTRESIIHNVRSYYRITEVAPPSNATKVLKTPPPKNGLKSSLHSPNSVSGSNPFREKAHWPPILRKPLWPVIMVKIAVPMLCINIPILPLSRR